MIAVTTGAKAVHITASVAAPTLCGQSPSVVAFVETDKAATCKRCIKSAARETENRTW